MEASGDTAEPYILGEPHRLRSARTVYLLSRIEVDRAEAERIELRRDVVEHDRGQELRDIEPRLEDARYESPHAASDHGCKQRKGQQQRPGNIGKRKRCTGECQDPHGHLSLCTDVYYPGSVCHRYAYGDYAQGNRAYEHFRDMEHPGKGLEADRIERSCHIRTGHPEDDRGHKKRGEYGQQNNHSPEG